jgi:chromosome segregation ATPase
MSGERSTATQAMARLVAERDRARDRVDELEREARTSGERAAAASAALTEFERRGGRAAERGKLEAELAEARAKAAGPWAERIAGARTRIGDHQAELQRFVGEHLQALVADREAEGEAAAARLTEAAERMLAAHREREQIAGEIAALVSMVGRVHPGEVSRSRAERLANAASALLMEGGEEPPRLRPDWREPRYGAPAESAA